MKKELKELARTLIFGIISVLCVFIPLSLIFGCGGYTMMYGEENIAQPTSSAPDLVIKQIKPKVKIWPNNTIEITAEFYDYSASIYNRKSTGEIYVKYEYYRNDRKIEDVKFQSKIYINPHDTDNQSIVEKKLPVDIYLDKNKKVVFVKIWGVDDYECPFDYSQMSGSLCQVAEDRYKFFCAPERLNCEAIINEILLKEPAEWL